MSRVALGLAVLAVLACAKKEKAVTDTTGAMAAESASAVVAAPPPNFAGKWTVRVMPENSDSTLLTYTLNATSDTSGWTFAFPNGNPIPVHVTISGDSILTEAGPYESWLRKGTMVVTNGTYRLEGDRLVGRVVAHYRTNKADSVGHTRQEGTRSQ
jgi:hypothetical protein